jgi:hypothetical protein
VISGKFLGFEQIMTHIFRELVKDPLPNIRAQLCPDNILVNLTFRMINWIF